VRAEDGVEPIIFRFPLARTVGLRHEVNGLFALCDVNTDAQLMADTLVWVLPTDIRATESAHLIQASSGCSIGIQRDDNLTITITKSVDREGAPLECHVSSFENRPKCDIFGHRRIAS
jgi:hypothetical protein